MNKMMKSYKIIIAILLLIICGMLLYPIITDINPNIHGSYLSGFYDKQNLITFDTSTNIYRRFIGGVIAETGTFTGSNLDNIFIIKTEEYSTYIVLNKDSTFYFFDHTSDDVLLFEKSSGAITFLN